MEIMKIGRVKIFAFLFKVPMVAADMGPHIVDGAPVIRPEIVARTAELHVPFPVMVDENMHVLMAQVPPDVVIIRF